MVTLYELGERIFPCPDGSLPPKFAENGLTMAELQFSLPTSSASVIQSVSFHRFTPIIAVLLSDGSIRITDYQNNTDRSPIDLHHLKQENASVIGWRPDKTQTLACGVKGGVLIWLYQLCHGQLSLGHRQTKSRPWIFSSAQHFISTEDLTPPTASFIPLPRHHHNDDVIELEWSHDGSFLIASTHKTNFIYSIGDSTFKVFLSHPRSPLLSTSLSSSNDTLFVYPNKFLLTTTYPSLTRSSWTLPGNSSLTCGCWTDELAVIADESRLFFLTRHFDEWKLSQSSIALDSFLMDSVDDSDPIPSISRVTIDPKCSRMAITIKGLHLVLLFAISPSFELGFIGNVAFEPSWGEPVVVKWAQYFKGGSLLVCGYSNGVVKFVPAFVH
ncbi:hypothetical protein P9112_001015 [Eukaryota sp. TZLM1-RC]